MRNAPRDAADHAARVSALKMALHLVAAHGTPGDGQNAAVAYLAAEIAHLVGGGTVHLCGTCMRPVVVTTPVAAGERVKCHPCRRAGRLAVVRANRRPSTAKR